MTSIRAFDPQSCKLLPPANEVCEGYVFTRVCQSFCSQGGWHVWLLGGMCGCSGGGHVLLLGGMCGCRGACVVAGGCACLLGGHVWLLWGACVGYDEIWSMSGWYTSYWNAFLYLGSIHTEIFTIALAMLRTWLITYS